MAARAEDSLHLADRLALRPKEAEEALGISEKTLRKWMRDDGLPYLRVDGVVLIPRDSLDAWMRERVASEHRSEALASEILDDL